MFQLSPSRVARYFYHECERHLRFFATPKPERSRAGVPDPPYDRSPVTKAILEGGYHWEEQVVTSHLAGRVLVAKAEKETLLRDCTFDANSTLANLGKLKPGEYLYQGTLVAPPAFYKTFNLDRGLVEFAACRPDLILRQDGDKGQPVYRIVDVKGSDALKTSHKVQTALYALLLQSALEEHGIPGKVDLEQAGIWLYAGDEPEWFDLNVVRPHVEAFLHDDLTRILKADPSAAAWHLNYRCEWCEYFEHCFEEAKKTGSVSLLPYLSTLGRSHLRSLGVNTLSELDSLLQREDAPDLLSQCAAFDGREGRIREAVAALLNDRIHLFGGSSLAMPVGENVRLVLTAQREPVSGRIYAAALLRTGHDEVFSSGRRHEMQYVAENPDDCDRVRREFVRQIYAILAELDRHNRDLPKEKQLSLQTYVFDSYEATLLRELLLSSLGDEEVAEEALALLFYFQGEELVTAEEHPAGETAFPLVVLTDVIRSLLALPVTVAYHLSDVARALPPERRSPSNYKPYEFYNFKLSNALRSDAIHRAWNHEEKKYLSAIEKQLKFRLRAVRDVVDGIRAAAKDPGTGQSVLFAWPPKFQLPMAQDFRYPILSRLAFLARYESLLSLLEVREGRTLPRAEREQSGRVFSLEALDEDRFLAEPFETAVDLLARPGRWLLVEDNREGDRAQMAFMDYVQYVPKSCPILFAEIRDVKADESTRRVELTLGLKSGPKSPKVIKGHRYLLCPTFVDWNTSRVVDRLKEIDQSSTAGTWISLLEDPLGFCRELRLSRDFAREATAFAKRAGFTPSQQKAYEHLLRHSLTLVWGPPGTGKTHFLAMSLLGLIRASHAAQRPLRVLVSAYTHAAIENCLKKIQDLSTKLQIPVDMVKLDGIKTIGYEQIESIDSKEGLNYLNKHSVCVVGATVYAMLKLLKGSPDCTPFDVVVIDEGSQVRVPEAMLAISRLADSGRLVVAGDHLQLPPIIRGAYPYPKPGEALVHRSIFEALREPDRNQNSITCQLFENFRMNDVLCQFPAIHLYGEKYQSATKEIASQRLSLLPAEGNVEDWLEYVLDPNYPLVLCVLEGIQAGAENQIEAGLVADVVRALRHRQTRPRKDSPYPPGEEGDREFWRTGLFVVSPHHVQIRAIKKALAARGLKEPYFVDTVDKLQGQECDSVVVSYGVSDPELAMREDEFIYSLNRLNVAITRARCKSIVFLPRPLLTPTLQVLENEDAAAGIAFMVELERYLEEGSAKVFPLDRGSLTVYRR